jgi:hypothetical protein
LSENSDIDAVCAIASDRAQRIFDPLYRSGEADLRSALQKRGSSGSSIRSTNAGQQRIFDPLYKSGGRIFDPLDGGQVARGQALTILQNSSAVRSVS